MQAASIRRIGALELEVASLRAKANTVRSQIRSLRSTLTSSNASPSVAAIQEHLRIENDVHRLSEAASEFDIRTESFSRLASEWSAISARKAALPRTSFSNLDEVKIKRLQDLFIEHTRAFGFTSLNPETLSIDPSSFRPIHGGFELEFDLSASDAVRVIWSYLMSLLDLGRQYPTNHPGILILDEPRQQSARRESLEELFRSASLAGQAGQQVIIATSEDRQTLRSLLTNIPHYPIPIEGRILKPMPP